jgi:hypothetical protein
LGSTTARSTEKATRRVCRRFAQGADVAFVDIVPAPGELLLGVLPADELPARVKRKLQNMVQLLQTYARLAELEMRAAEEPLEGDLDVGG